MVLPALAAILALLNGRVVEQHTGNPVAGADVRVYRASAAELAADLETDAEGQFHAAGLEAGEYRVEISKPNYQSAKLQFEIKGVEPPALAIKLVRLGAIAGRVTDASGSPVPGVAVMALQGGATGHPVTTRDDGRYRLFHLAPGKYTIAASYGASTFAMGASGHRSTPERFGSGVLYSSDVQLRQGEEIDNIDFTVTPGATFDVSGKVEGAEGKTWLALTPVAQPGIALAVTEAKTDGNFRFESVPPGSYLLLASSPVAGRSGRGAVLDQPPRFGRSSVEVTGQSVENIAVTLHPALRASLLLSSDPPCASNAESHLIPNEDWGAWLDRTTTLLPGQPVTLEHLAPGVYRVEVQNLPESCAQVGNALLDLTNGPLRQPLTISISRKGSP